MVHLVPACLQQDGGSGTGWWWSEELSQCA
jgi:hypothetical protein